MCATILFRRFKVSRDDSVERRHPLEPLAFAKATATCSRLRAGMHIGPVLWNTLRHTEAVNLLVASFKKSLKALVRQ